MKRIIAYIFCALLLSAGCDKLILDTPEGGGIDPSLVNFNLNLAVDPAMEPYVPSGKAAGPEEKAVAHDVRWIVEIFRDEIDGEPEASCVLTCDPAPDGNHRHNTSFDLHAGKYVIVAWADYVDDGSVADKYYNVSSLSQISIAAPEDYIGNEEHKDTYVAVEEVDLTKSRNLIIVAVILVTALGIDSLDFTIGEFNISLTALAVAAIAGIVLNAILPGNDYQFDKVDSETAENPMNMQV